MTSQTVIDIMQEAFKVAMFLALPALGFALVTGVLVSVFQSVTSIQEQTLIFVPKILAVILAIVVFFSWMLNTILTFTERLFLLIPHLIK